MLRLAEKTNNNLDLLTNKNCLQMKKILPLSFILFSFATLLAQAPLLINYQAIVRGATGQPVNAGTVVALRFTIHDGSPTDTAVFIETQHDTTNQFGLVNTHIGTSNNLAIVNWSTGNKYLEVELDPAGGNNFTNMGTSQLTSVPYALFAANSQPGPQGVTGATGANGGVGPTGLTGPTGAGVAGPTRAQPVQQGPLALRAQALPGPQVYQVAPGHPALQGQPDLLAQALPAQQVCRV